MRRKVLAVVIGTLVLLLGVLVPAAWAAKWSFGNGQHDISLDTTSTGAVCSTRISGRAGVGTTTDPAVTPPPPLPTSGFVVEIYWDSSQVLDGGATHVGSQLLLGDGVTLIHPNATVTTAAPVALDPVEQYTGFSSTDKIWEYGAAPFSVTIPGGIPVGDTVVIVKAGYSAYDITTAVSCSSATTSTALSSAPNPSTAGQTAVFTATVTDAAAQPVTSGGVDFYLDGAADPIGPVALGNNGQAVLNWSVFPTGDHRVVASYTGTATLPGSNSPTVIQTVTSSTDTSPPVIAYALSPSSPGNGGWYRSPVSLTWTVSDPESPSSVVTTGCVNQLITTDQAKVGYPCSATSDGGSSGPVTVQIGYDATKPTLSPSLAEGAVFAVGQPAPAVTTGASDALSGLASSACSPVSTTTVGTGLVQCTAVDQAGNAAKVTRHYAVTNAFLGFTNPTTTSVLHRNQTIQVTFGLGTYSGPPVASGATVRVTVTRPSAPPTPPTSTSERKCTATSTGFACRLQLPGKRGQFVIRAWQNVGSSTAPHFVLIANAASVAGTPSANPIPITVRP